MRIRLPEYKWQIFFVTGVASIAGAISITSINLALPVMAVDFGVSMTAVSWMSLIYSLIPSCVLLVFGKLGDLFGYKRQFIGGFFIFGTTSLLLPVFAAGLVGAIAFRSIQAIGYSMLISITQALINRTFPTNERGKALGVNSIFVSVGMMLGPSIGGLLLEHFSWRAIFFFNAPFCFLGLATSILILKKDEGGGGSLRQMDWPGAAFSAAFICALAVAINFSADWGLTSPVFIGVLVFAVVAFVLFIHRERRAELPFMNLDLFRDPHFTFANSASVLSWILQQMTIFLVPFFLINLLLVPKDDSGLIMLAMPFAMMIFSPIGGMLADRYGSRRPAVIGLSIIAAGCLMMSTLNLATPVALVFAILLCYGIGNGFSMSAVNAAIFVGVPREQSGLASGMVATMRNLGQGLGVAFGGAIMAIRQMHYYRVAQSGTAVVDANHVYLMAQRDAFYFGLVVVAAAIFCMSRIPGKSSHDNEKTVA